LDAGAAYIHRLSCVPFSQAKTDLVFSSPDLCPGGTLQINSEAYGGTPPVNIQWRKNGINIAGATSSLYTITNATLSDAGTYDFIVSNACGADLSTSVNVTVFSFAVFPTTLNIGAAGSSGLLGVIATGPCAWTAQSNAPWITITSGASGSGNGNVGFTVTANTGAQRVGTMTVAGQTVTVTQDSVQGSTIFVEEGSNRLAAYDSVTHVHGPFALTDNFNFSSDHRTRIIFFTTSLGFSAPAQPDNATLSVQVGGFSVPVEIVGPITISGNNFSYIMLRLPDLPPGDWPLSIQARGVNSINSPTLTIIASPSSPSELGLMWYLMSSCFRSPEFFGCLTPTAKTARNDSQAPALPRRGLGSTRSTLTIQSRGTSAPQFPG